MADRIQQRRDTAARWASFNPILLEGEIGYVLDNPNQYKIGDGIRAWNDLPLRGYNGNIIENLESSSETVLSVSGAGKYYNNVFNGNIFDFSYKNGYLNYQNGDFLTLDNAICSEFIILKSNEIHIKTLGATAKPVWGYDENFIKIKSYGISSLEILEQKIIIPIEDNVKYIRVWSFKSNEGIYAKFKIVEDEKLSRDYLTPPSSKLINEKMFIATYSDNVFKIPEICIFGYINFDGTLKTDSGTDYICTEYIDIRDRGRYLYYRTMTGASRQPIAAYDANKTFLRFYGLNGTTAVEGYEVIGLDVAYIRVWGLAENIYCKIYQSEQLLRYELSGDLMQLLPTTKGFIGFDGNLSTSAAHICTDYIDVSFFKTWYISYNTGASRQPIAAYDANKTFLRFYGQADANPATATITLGGDVKYMRYWTLNGTQKLIQLPNNVNGNRELIVVSSTVVGAKYTNIVDFFANESAGDKDIYLPDALYQVDETQYFYFRNGWKFYGNGIDNTVIKFKASTNLTKNTFDVIGSCTLSDLTIINHNPTTGLTSVGYCLHIDSNIDNLTFHCERVKLKVDNTDIAPDTYNGLALGIGLWNNQKLTFKDCVFDTVDNVNQVKGILNFHNNAHSQKKPSKLIFENCIFGFGSSSCLINETATQIPLADRGKDELYFINCTIKSFVVYYTFGSKNGYNCNWSGTKVYGFIDAWRGIDVTATSYSDMSLPKCDQVDFLENRDTAQINNGVLVSYIRETTPVYWNDGVLTGKVIKGVKASTVGDIVNGVSMVDIAVGKRGHILKRGVVKLNGYTFTGAQIGGYVKQNGTNIITATEQTNMIYLGDNMIELL